MPSSSDHTSKTISLLEESSLLCVVPGLSSILLEHGEVLVISPGSKLCQEGERIPSLVFPISQNVRLVRRQDSNEEVLIGYLQKKRALCLGEILRGEPAPYSALCEFETTVLSVSVEIFISHLEALPEEAHYLRLMTRSESTRKLKRFLAERKVNQKIVMSLLRHVSAKPYKQSRGEIVLDGNCLYLIDEGSIEIERNAAYGKKVLLSLGEGAWFGGEAIVPPHKYSYRAFAVEACKLRKLPIKEVSPALSQVGLLEAFYDEPWIPSSRSCISYQNSERCLPLPGQKLSDSESAYLLRNRPFVTAGSPIESLIASIQNLGNLKGFVVNPASILDDLSFYRAITPLRIAESIERFGLITTNIKCDIQDLKRQMMPVLAFIKGRYCTLLEVRERHIILLDPCHGVWVLAEEEFKGAWSGELLDIREAQTDKMAEAKEKPLTALPPIKTTDTFDNHHQKPFNKLLFRSFAKFFSELSPLFWNQAGILALTFVIGLITPKFINYMVDSALELRDINPIIILCFGALIFQIMSALFELINGFSRAHFAIRFENRIDMLFYRQALRVLRKGDLRSALKEMQSRLGEISQVKHFLSEILFTFISYLLALVTYSLILFWYDWKLTAIAFLSLPLLIGIRLLYRKRLYDNYDRFFQQERELSGFASDQINAISTIKSFGAEEHMRHKWENIFVKSLRTTREIVLETGAVNGVMSFLGSLINVGILYLTYEMAAKKEISLGALFAVQAYVGSLLAPLSGLAGLFDEIERIRVAQDKVSEVFEVTPDEPPKKAKVSHSVTLRGKIRLERVGFRYSEDRPWVLNDLEFTIYPQQRVAIVGKSGCGKTTLAKLLCGLLLPTTGRIYFDDLNTDLLSQSSLKKQIGMILQENQLFRGTIQENIAFGDDFPDEKAVRRAAFLSGAESFIEEMPSGFDYMISEGGLGLSGGQKQRIAIARTLYRDPKILILDETTSALDAESESIVVDRMKNLVDGKTTIIIAHRLSTIRNSDRILVMKDGRIVEDGDHQTMMTNKSHYAELFREQLKSLNELGAVA